MLDELSSAKSQLRLTACIPGRDTPNPIGKSISLLINPSELKLSRKTKYAGCVPMGDIGSGRNFSKIQPGQLDFSTVFDGTGVVPVPSNISLPSQVESQLNALDSVIYTYKGKQHEPNVVQVLWGTLMFYGRLTSFNIEYTLFRPSGAPLRANVSLSFEGYKDLQQTILEADLSSPDLSHKVVVMEGDTLPLLCHRIYGDSRYYVDVARFNGLHAFRALKPGLTLHFPPLD